MELEGIRERARLPTPHSLTFSPMPHEPYCGRLATVADYRPASNRSRMRHGKAVSVAAFPFLLLPQYLVDPLCGHADWPVYWDPS